MTLNKCTAQITIFPTFKLLLHKKTKEDQDNPEQLRQCTYFEIIPATNWLRTCACSLGGPGRKRDEHSGGRSTLGTE